MRSINLPEELKSIPQWVVWRRETREGKPTKVPYNAKTGRLASVSDSSTWNTLDVALKASECGYNGVGIVLTESLGLVGIDLDHCVENGVPNAWAQNIIDRFHTYTELSPSGEGIRLWLYGEIPTKGRRKGNFEIYTQGRYLTVTGNRLDGKPNLIQQGGYALERLYNEIFPPQVETKIAAPSRPMDKSDTELLTIMFDAKNGAKAARLWHGDASDYENDESRADFALCLYLAFYWGSPMSVDRMFRQSLRMRPKWDAKRGAMTYGQITIQKAFSRCQSFYNSRFSKTTQKMGNLTK